MRQPGSLRIVFMGTPGFAAGVLRKLIADKYNVVAVVTAPDKQAGRGLKVQQSEVKQLAVEHCIAGLRREKLASSGWLAQRRSFRADRRIVVAFRMLPEVVWQMRSLGTLNLD